MNEVLAQLVQAMFARTATDPAFSGVVLGAVCAAVEGDPAALRGLVVDEQVRAADALAAVQAYQLPEG